MAVFVVVGCATTQPYVAPVDVRLQDPPPGKAVVYLVRAPYDSSHVAVFSGAAKLATLPPDSYTAIALLPGEHVLITKTAATVSADAQVAPPYELRVRADERRFLNLSGLTSRRPVFVGVLPIAGGGVIPLIEQQQATKSGSLTWKEVTEIDAQGLMSIAKPALPEKGAL